jgi:hypothetical protein
MNTFSISKINGKNITSKFCSRITYLTNLLLIIFVSGCSVTPQNNQTTTKDSNNQIKVEDSHKTQMTQKEQTLWMQCTESAAYNNVMLRLIKKYGSESDCGYAFSSQLKYWKKFGHNKCDHQWMINYLERTNHAVKFNSDIKEQEESIIWSYEAVCNEIKLGGCQKENIEPLILSECSLLQLRN